jgi:hypothetical protein
VPGAATPPCTTGAVAVTTAAGTAAIPQHGYCGRGGLSAGTTAGGAHQQSSGNAFLPASVGDCRSGLVVRWDVSRGRLAHCR